MYEQHYYILFIHKSINKQVRFKFSGNTAEKVEQFVRLSVLVLCYTLIILYLWGFRVYTKIIEGSLIYLSIYISSCEHLFFYLPKHSCLTDPIYA